MLEMIKARKEQLEARGEKGFTLMEMLIVIAIIAVLIAIAIPLFTAQLENAREATDAANIRSAYAEMMAHGLSDPAKDFTATVKKQQAVDGWDNTSLNSETIGGISVNDLESTADTVLTYDADNGTYKIDGKDVVTTFEKTQP